MWLWRRGVDSTLFHPGRRDEAIRRALAPNGETVVGYVGRLAAEKRVDLLAATAGLRGVRVVVVGDGPARAALQKALPDAVFVGERHGTQLARLYASLDVFVHTGPLETFCQAVQEALASGVPVVAPAAGGPLDLVQPGRTGYLVPARRRRRDRRGRGRAGRGPGAARRTSAAAARAVGAGAHVGGGRRRADRALPRRLRRALASRRSQTLECPLPGWCFRPIRLPRNGEPAYRDIGDRHQRVASQTERTGWTESTAVSAGGFGRLFAGWTTTREGHSNRGSPSG